jgi:O-antigen/teichoic acid export membrane protein
MIDGLADVYEGRLQQMDKLYLAGISQALRSFFVIIIFTLTLLITRNLPVACIAMAIAAAASFIVITLPLALLETPKSPRFSLSSIKALFVQCFPLFIALFVYALIDTMPKFVMEGALSYDNQLYFNALYFPAQAILLTVGLIYKPMLVRMANLWTDQRTHRLFDIITAIILAAVLVVTVAMIFVVNFVGLQFLSFIYGVDFEEFRGLCLIMVAAGGIIAIIDFLYQIIVVLRSQASAIRPYLIAFGFSLFVPVLLVIFTGLPGAVIGYLIVMCLLLVLLVWEYVRIRINFRRENSKWRVRSKERQRTRQ